MPLGEDKASYRVHVQQNPTTPMTSQQLCGSALALFWAALQRQDESRRNDSEIGEANLRGRGESGEAQVRLLIFIS